MKHLLVRLANEDSGQDMIEYALVAAIVGLSATAVLRNLKTNLFSVFTTIGTTLTNSIS